MLCVDYKPSRVANAQEILNNFLRLKSPSRWRALAAYYSREYMPKQAASAARPLQRIQRTNVPNGLHIVPTLNLFESIWRTNIIDLLRRPKYKNQKCKSSEVSQLPASGEPITYWNGNSNKWLHRLLRNCCMHVEKGKLAAISGGAVCCLESSRRCTESSRRCIVLYTYHNVPYHTVP
jgi:hypothetical protein